MPAALSATPLFQVLPSGWPFIDLAEGGGVIFHLLPIDQSRVIHRNDSTALVSDWTK
jgi:hypothetical protein